MTESTGVHVTERLHRLNFHNATLIYPTRLGSNRIRIVNLRKGEPEDGICCDLEDSALDQTTEYEALSYCWGGHDAPVIINLNRHAFHITQNLALALKHLRSREKDRRLWVDALAINQTDVEERNQQVQQMYQVYKSATQVLAWIGDDEDKNFEIVQYYVRREERKHFDFAEVASLPEASLKEHLRPFVYLVLRIYWRRLWVVQELTHAKHVQVLCGPFSIPYKGLIDTYRSMLRSNEAWPYFNEVLNVASRAATHFLDWRPGQKLEFESSDSLDVLEILMAINLKLCGDLKDYVFAIHSLLPAKLQQRITIDYSASVADVYANATQAIVESYDTISIITYQPRWAELPDHKDFVDIPMLPSWALNWAADLLEPISAHIRNTDINADKNVKPYYEFSNRCVEVRGVSIGIVDYAQTINWDRDERTDNLLRFTSLIDQHGSILKDLLKHRPVDRATYARTCLAGASMFSEKQLRLATLAFDDQDRSGEMQISDQTDRAFGENCGWLRERAMFQFLPSSAVINDDVDLDLLLSSCIGLGHRCVRRGDVVTVLAGFKTPVILRPVATHYEVVGDAYVDIFMHGEAMQDFKGDYDELESFIVR